MLGLLFPKMSTSPEPRGESRVELLKGERSEREAFLGTVPVIQRLEIRPDDRDEFEAAVATLRALAAKEAPTWAEFVKIGPVSIAGAELVVKS
jgi:hypothetical protein